MKTARRSSPASPARPVEPLRAAGFDMPDHGVSAPFDMPGAAGLGTEWLLTDGRGGFSMGSASGVPARRYHALFIAAMRPPVGRCAMLNAVADRLVINPDSPAALPVELSSFRFAGSRDRLHPDGASRLTSFRRDGQVHWSFDLPVARVTRTLHLHRDRAAATLRYTVARASGDRMPPGGLGSRAPATLRLSVRPLVSLRDMHGLIRRDGSDRFAVSPGPDGRGCRVERDGRSLRLRADSAVFVHDQQWWFDFFYAEDAARGQDCIEDLFSPGCFCLELAPGQDRAELCLHASIDDLPVPSAADLEREVAVRADRLAPAVEHAANRAAGPPAPEDRRAIEALVAAADDFIVARPGGVSVIAGYPWFSDWGRDTFVSLPGLMLVTGRLDEARETLMAFAAHQRDGLIPNVFNDQTGQAEYNTVDGSLWFIQAACAWREACAAGAGGERDLAAAVPWAQTLLPACLDIIAHYRRGTGGELNIAMDPFDKLITAGTSATQLTWMDARRDGVTFTPRHGKAVEINALWISGLRRLAALLPQDRSATAANLSDLAEAAARSFRRCFWNPQARCLFDVLTPSDSERGPVTWTPDASIRPNQIFAVSLPHSPLSIQERRAVVECVRSRLLTPRGVRTLDPADPRYRGRYEGDLFHRDGAYHQGTAWPWLLGPLAEAILRVGEHSPAARREAREVIQPLLVALGQGGASSVGCLGQVAEIFDGDPPQRPQGCPAQAWSVAELLRVLVLCLP